MTVVYIRGKQIFYTFYLRILPYFFSLNGKWYPSLWAFCILAAGLETGFVFILHAVIEINFDFFCGSVSKLMVSREIKLISSIC